MTDTGGLTTNKVRDLTRRFEEWERAQQAAASNLPNTPTVDINKSYYITNRQQTTTPNGTDNKDDEDDNEDDNEDEDDLNNQPPPDQSNDIKQLDQEPNSRQSFPPQPDGDVLPEEDPQTTHSFDVETLEADEDEIYDEPSDFTPPSDEDLLSPYRLHDRLIQDGARDLNLDIRHVQKLGLGIKGYAFVRENSGMLKPVTIFFHPISERLLIIRQKEDRKPNVLYVKVNTLKEIDRSEDTSLDYLIKNTDDELLIRTVEDVKAMPHCVLWTNSSFGNGSNGREVSRFYSIKRRILGGSKTSNVPKRSIVLVSESPEDIDSMIQLCSATANKIDHSLEIKPPLLN